MKILQLCNKPSFPPVDGGSAAMNSITQGLLSSDCQVKVFSVSSDKHPVLFSKISEDYLKSTDFESVYVDLKLNPIHALTSLLSGESYHIKRFISKDFEKKLIEILEETTFDIIHVESIFLTPYIKIIRRYADAKIVLRAHNVENLIWKRIADGIRNPLKAWYIKHLALTLRAYELEHINDYDGIVCISDKDEMYFRQNGCRKPITTVPFGINPVEQNYHVTVEEGSLYHLASMDWLPNQEGIKWFLDKVWPSVEKKLLNVKLYIAGRKMPASFFKYGEIYSNVNVEGEVDNVNQYIADKQINIVPLLSGSGIRIKILEAMSMGKTVITTTLGAEGIQYERDKDLLIADTPEEFLIQIERCVNDAFFCKNMGDNAYRLILEQYSVPVVTNKLIDFYKSL